MDAPAFSFDEYSQWSRRLAVHHSIDDLERMLGVVSGAATAAAHTHLRAIGRSTSMQSNSQARAQSGNVVAAAGERKMAVSAALELHRFYPERIEQERKAISARLGVATVRLCDAEPGDTLDNGMILVQKRIKTHREARRIARESDGVIYEDSSRTSAKWYVVKGGRSMLD